MIILLEVKSDFWSTLANYTRRTMTCSKCIVSPDYAHAEPPVNRGQIQNAEKSRQHHVRMQLVQATEVVETRQIRYLVWLNYMHAEPSINEENLRMQSLGL